jgi:hypothetical protein
MSTGRRVYALQVGGSEVTALVKEVRYFGYVQGVRVTLLGLGLQPGRRTFPRERGHVYCSHRAAQDARAVRQALTDSGHGEAV